MTPDPAANRNLPAADTRRPDANVPASLADRARIRREAAAFVAGRQLTPPVRLDRLRALTAEAMAASAAPDAWWPYVAVVVHNALWRDAVAAVPFHKRLLLLPQCLRDADHCPADIDELGLLCHHCGRCRIDKLTAEAEALGYVVLVAEGSAVVMSLIESGRVEAVVGVSCLSVLEQVFPYMEAAAIPGLAVPLLHDGCRNTGFDTEHLLEMLYLCDDQGGGRIDIEALREQVQGMFTPAALAEVLGTPASQTERIAHDWLARAGKRWRPLLAVAAGRALAGERAGSLTENLRRIAVAVECFHKASLIHDDIEDDDDARYGQPTLHVAHGPAVALNVGDLLLGEGYRLIASCDLPADRKAELLAIATDGHRRLCLGQGAELCWRREPRVLPVDEVVDIFRGKTAPAFAVALRMGATCADAAEATTAALGRFCEALGVAYQIRDDLDDLLCPEPGRPADWQGLRPSAVLALAHARATDPADRNRIAQAWLHAADHPAATETIARLVADRPLLLAAQTLLESYKDHAIDALAEVQSTSLKSLCRRLLGRIFYDVETLLCCVDQPHHPGRTDIPT